MKKSYEEIIEILEIDKNEEMLCAEKCLWLMKRTLNPIRKLDCYISSKRFRDHVFGMDLTINKLKRLLRES